MCIQTLTLTASQSLGTRQLKFKAGQLHVPIHNVYQTTGVRASPRQTTSAMKTSKVPPRRSRTCTRAFRPVSARSSSSS